jgi:alcohol dehydrogenase, propanol-preferring
VVGLLAPELTMYSLIAVPKHLKILTSFGGNREELRASLDLIARGVITPQVDTAPLSDLAKVLHDLHDGKIKSRIALVPEELGLPINGS